MSETRVACCAILAVALLMPGSGLRAAEAADPTVLLEQGRYERLREVLASVYLDGGDRKSGGVYLEQALALLEKIAGRSKAERGGALSGEIARLKDRLKRTRR